MDEECFRLDELGALLDLDPEDPRQKHLAACPLCRARLAAYRTFITEGPPLAGSRPEIARAELEAFLDGMIHQGAQAKEKSGIGDLLRALRIPRRALVPGLVAAAIAAVVLIFALNPFRDGDRQRAPLRGLDSRDTGRYELAARSAVSRGGYVTFSWAHLPDSDKYEIQIFDTKLEEIASFETGRDTSLTVRGDDIPDAEGPLFWRVAAYREGDEIAHSRLLSLDPGMK